MENCSTEINSTRNSSTIFTIFRSKPKQQSEASKQVWTRLTLLGSTRCGAGIDDAAPSATRAAAASHGTKRQRRTKASRGRDRGCHRRLRLPEAIHRVRLRPNPYWMEAIHYLLWGACACRLRSLVKVVVISTLAKTFLKVCLPSLYYFAYLLFTTVTLDLEPFS